MKNNTKHTAHEAGKANGTAKSDASDQPSQNKTPYLKSILSGTVKFLSNEDERPAIDADRIAAIRYIKESGLLRRLYFGKMSC